MSGAVTVIQQAGEGERMWFAGGGTFTWKATADETGGAFLLLEDHMQGGKVTPYHLHPHEDEAFWVLEGEILLDADGARHRVGTGGFAFVPRGVPHAFMVTSDSARIIAWQTPGSGEAFYRDCGETIRTPEDEHRPPDWDRLRAVAASSDRIEILGPPPFEPAERSAGMATA